MKLFSLFSATMGFFLFLYAATAFFNTNTPAWKRQISSINREIEEFQKMKKGYELRAGFHQNQAQKLGFEKKELLTAKRHHILAKENEKIVKKLQEDISALSDKKNKIIKSYK